MNQGDIHNLMKMGPIESSIDWLAVADGYVSAYPDLVIEYRNTVYREYNRRRLFEAGGTLMLEPYDAGLRPLDYAPP